MKVPSRAKLGHFNFQAETELTICASLSSKFFRFSNFASVTWFESISWWSIIHLNFCSIKVHNFVIFQCFSEQVYSKKKILACFCSIFNSELKWKRSRAEPSWKTFSSSYGSSQLCSDSSLVFLQYHTSSSSIWMHIFLSFLGSGLKLYKHIHHKLYLIVKGYNFLVVR